MSNILMTGANGLIGTRLQVKLLEKGHVIKTIGRATNGKTQHGYTWDPPAGKMNENALKGVNAIIHLAGAGVADKRWSKARKKEILESRVQSTRLLFDTLSHHLHQVTTIVSASASGYYGDSGDKWLKEDMPASDSFLGEVCRRWEEEVAMFEKIGIRHVCCRIGIVLSPQGGALPELMKTFPMGVAGYLAKNPLYYPWVHIDDVCGIFTYAIENEKIRGSYNANAPDPLLIKDLIEAIVEAKKSNAVLMPVPPIALRLAMGEMADMLLGSQRCSSDKIRLAGYRFLFPEIKDALNDLFH
jgi:uncharacterized protein (TIGR01777 family)